MDRNNKSRRDFLAKIGLLSGAMVVGNRSYASELARAARFNLNSALDAVHVYCTGNRNSSVDLWTVLPEAAVQSENALWLSAGNFVDAEGRYRSTVDYMNGQGYQVAAIGENEWRLGDKKLLELAKRCDFSLVKSHGYGLGSESQSWIKPYEIINLQGRRIGVLAMGPAEGESKNRLAWKEMEEWGQKIKTKMGCDMIICLVPTGYTKAFVMNCLAQSRTIDVLNCASIADLKPGTRVLKNADKRDVLFMSGCSTNAMIAKQVFSLAGTGLVLPQLMSLKKLQQV